MNTSLAEKSTDTAKMSKADGACKTAIESPTNLMEGKSVTYSMSAGFTGLLARLNISVAVTSYQSGKFYLLGRNPAGRLMLHERMFQKAMGMWVADRSLILATLFRIH